MRKTAFLLSLGRACISLFPVLLLGGCSLHNMPLLDPKGPVGLGERNLIIDAFLVMLIPVIPVFVMAFWFAWRYRASNAKATYRPKWSFSGKIEAVIWSVPALIVLSLSVLTWNSTHALSPYKPLASTQKPVRVQAIATDWKWLFIYPDLNIATVNELVFPAKVPVDFQVTSDTVMSAFFIPRLGSQIYAMAGMKTPLHLMADSPGQYTGMNAQFSGRGFSGMHFKAIATSRNRFRNWVAKVRRSDLHLDAPMFRKLEKPSEYNPVQHFSAVEPELFAAVIDKYQHGKMRGHGLASAGALDSGD